MMKSRSPLEITRAVIFALLLREMRTRFGQRRLGAFWMLAEPVVHLIVLSVLMGLIRGRGPIQGIPFEVFLFTGIGPFLMFRGVMKLLMDGISANRGLFAYKQITPMDTFVARTIMQCSISSIAYLLVLAIFGWYGFDVSIYAPLEWLGLVAVGVATAFGIGMVLAVIVDFAPPTRTFIGYLLNFLYLTSGTIFPVSRFPEYILPYILWNPYLHLIEMIRAEIFQFYEPIRQVSPEYAWSCMVVFLFVGLGLFRIRRWKMLAIKGIR